MATPEKELRALRIRVADHDVALHWFTVAVGDTDHLRSETTGFSREEWRRAVARLQAHTLPYWFFGLFVLQILAFDLASGGQWTSGALAERVSRHTLFTLISLVLGLFLTWMVGAIPRGGQSVHSRIRLALIVGPLASVGVTLLILLLSVQIANTRLFFF